MSQLHAIAAAAVAGHQLDGDLIGCTCGHDAWSADHVADAIAAAVDNRRSPGIDLAVLDEILWITGAWLTTFDDRVVARLTRLRGHPDAWAERAQLDELDDDLGHGRNLLARLRRRLGDLAHRPDQYRFDTETTDATSRDVAPETTEAQGSDG